jgi:predicted XRE-type DNA-binding protein
MNKGEIIIYQTPDGETNLNVRLENETIWLTQAQIAELFGIKRPAITKHLNNIFKSGELKEINTCSILEHMGNDARQTYHTKYFNLDAILSVGYRVNSKNATQFRIWANKILKEYIIKGYAIDHRVKVEQLKELKQTVQLLSNVLHPHSLRKVHGATTGKLLVLLCKTFFIWCAIATIIALPIGYYISKYWLEGFVYRIDNSLWTLLFTALIAAVITFLTVIFQTTKAALANPARFIKME